MTETFSKRRDQARHAMRSAGFDLLLLGPGPGFRYFTGLNAIATERFVSLAIGSDGHDRIFTPRLQEPLYAGIPDVNTVVWDEADNPLAQVAHVAREASVKTIAVNPEFWSGFLITLKALMPDVALHSGGSIIDDQRCIKHAGEIAALESAAAHIDAVWARFCEATPSMVGRTELELRADIDRLMRQEGFSEVSWVDVGAGANGASPLHHGSDHMIRAGEPVVFDFAGCYNGYYGDICRVAISGEPSPDFQKIYEVVQEAQEAAFQAVRPGVRAEEIDAIARRIITEEGFGPYFTHRLGHGIGLAAHEEPYIVAGNSTPLVAGMVFSNEPGIYIPGHWGVRIEDIVVVTAGGARRLTHSPRHLVRLD
ncbi:MULTISPECIES: Xaa-Pro peptidase family protein [unclassified Chelatococcus]|uniref:M24 family metallopeptidase n=1 Tax=unclassified Chelatococcus TaxID=2638111 RepID=UPI001BCB6BB5|nr:MULTISPECIES: Xaa-Pro peptidase family protein [unclassified Chelatococcus]MBS7701196.1 aminopeptidase P family protein [Chelatococcus sp. YT9]MBX3557327.1 aminopeptidase P family protein [Chelatococcus sp.]